MALPASDEGQARAAVVAAVRRLDAAGLNRGSSGNASQRWHDGRQPGMLITPTGMGAEVEAEDLVFVADDGRVSGRWQPSSEWPLHRAAYRARPQRQAVLHTHAVHATALACLGRALPAFHYMVAVAGGADVPLVPYAAFGSDALAAGVAAALADREACLLAQHGLVSAGVSMEAALRVMFEVEHLCQTYLLALAVAEPPTLDAAEMARVVQRFRSYGQRAQG
jgi:L-fuculose-phosphate aldolase